MNEHLERITPTKENLDKFFEQFPDHKQRYHFAKDIINKNMEVADCACGVGYGTYLLASNCKRIIGFDIAQTALKHAKQHFKLDNNDFLHANNIDKNSFDFIISFETIEHMNEKEGDIFLNNFKKALKKGGKLLISTPINKTNHKHNVTPYHIREYDDVEFPNKLKKNGFNIIKMYGQGSNYHEKLYGENNNSFSIFSLMKLGIHKILPKQIREMLKAKILGNPKDGLKISEYNWQNSAVQIALCEVVD